MVRRDHRARFARGRDRDVPGGSRDGRVVRVQDVAKTGRRRALAAPLGVRRGIV